MTRIAIALILLCLMSFSPAHAGRMSGGGSSGGTSVGYRAIAIFFSRAEGLQTTPNELDNFTSLEGSSGGQYTTDLTALGVTAADSYGASWDWPLTAGNWDSDSSRCEPVGLTTAGDFLREAAADIYAMALYGYLMNDTLYYADARTRLLQLAATADFENDGIFDGSDECALDLGTAVPTALEAAWILGQDYSGWTNADRVALATWAVDEAGPLMSWAVVSRKNNWGLVTLGGMIATAAYAEGGITSMPTFSGTTDPTSYLANADELLLAQLSTSNTLTQSSLDCSFAAQPYGLQTHGGFPDELRRSVGTVDCGDDTIIEVMGSCVAAGTCATGTSHFYQQKATNAFARIAEALRRIDGNGARGFDIATHGGANEALYDAASFSTTGFTTFVQNTTMGFVNVAGGYYNSSALLALSNPGVVPLRGGLDFPYTRITHAAGVSIVFVTMANSSYGPGATIATDNLTSRMATWTPIGDPDTTGWSDADSLALKGAACDSETVVSDTVSTRASIQALITSECNGTDAGSIIWLPNCAFDVMLTYPSGGNVFSVPATCDNVMLKGQANTEIRLKPSSTLWFQNQGSGSDDYGDKVRASLFTLESFPSPITGTCAVTGSHTLNSKVLTLSGACDITSSTGTWGNASIISLVTSDYSNASGSGSHEIARRLTCIDPEGAVLASGTDCSLVTSSAVNTTTTVQIDWPLPINYTASSYQFSIATVTANVLETKGNGATDTNRVREGVWFDGIDFDNSAAPYVNDAFLGYIKFLNCVDCGVINSEFDPKGSAIGVMDSPGGGSGVTRAWIAHNTFRGPSSATKCIGTIQSISPSGGNVRVVIAAQPTSGDCDNTNSAFNGDVFVYVSSGASEPSIRDRKFRASAYSYNSVSGTNTVTLSPLQALESGCTGGGAGVCSTGSGGYLSILDHYGTTTIISDSGSDPQVVDNIFESAKGLMTTQNGTVGAVFAYNYSHTPLGDMWWRGYFDHGNGNGGAALLEGNDVEGLTYRASSTASPGGRLHDTWIYNRLRDQGTGISFENSGSLGDVNPLGRGALECDESDDLSEEESATSEYVQFIGNSVGGTCVVVAKGGMDWWNDPSGIPGIWHLYSSKNLWYDEDVDSAFRSDNETTLNRDSKDVGGGLNVYGASAEADEADVAPAAWANWTFPSSPLYDTAASRSVFVDGKPPWACIENAPIGEWVGSRVDNMAAGGNSGNPKLPAQLRREGGCTPLAASRYVSTTGSNSNPGTLAEPWLTISYAATRVSPGDSVLIASGVYSEQVTFTTSGTLEDPIVFRGASGGGTVIDGTGVAGVDPNEALVQIAGADYFDLDNVEVRDSAYDGINVLGESHHVEIEGVYSHSNGRSGIFMSGPEFVAAHNSVINSTTNLNGRGGIVLWRSDGGYFLIEGNTSRNNTGAGNYDGIQIGGGEEGTHHVVVRGNTITDNDAAGLADNLDFGGHGLTHHYLGEQNNISGSNQLGELKLHTGTTADATYTAGVSGFSILRFNRVTGHGLEIYGFPDPFVFYNNTMFDCQECFHIYTVLGGVTDVGDSTYTSGDTGRLNVKNNLIFQNAASTAYLINPNNGVGTFDYTYGSMRFRNNLYRPAAAHQLAWNGIVYNPFSSGNFTTYKASSSPDLPDTGSIFSSVTSATMFSDSTIDNYCLQPASPATNVAATLTTTVGAGTNSTTLIVDRASYFVDGYCSGGECVTDSDTIVIGATSPVRIVSINDATNTITLAESRTWTSGLNVTLSSLYTDPDIGGGVCN